jgi:hypothetical protein
VLPAEFQRWSVNGEPKNERQLTLSAGEWHFEMDKSAHSGTMYLRVPEGTSAQVVLPAEFQRWSVNGELKNERQLTLAAGEWHFEMSEK